MASDTKKQIYEVTVYDRLCELAINSYELNKVDRTASLKDKLQYFILWWFNNRGRMKAYNRYSKIAKLLNKNHATIVHHIRRRKPTLFYDINTECIKDFLNVE